MLTNSGCIVSGAFDVRQAKKTGEFHKQYMEAMEARQAMESLKKDLLLLPEEVVQQL